VPPENGDPQTAGRDAASSRRRPRYGVRRATVAGGIIAVIAVAVAGVVVVTRNGDGEDRDAIDAPGWDGVIAIDQSTGQATVFDGDGNAGDTVDLGIDLSPTRFASGDTLIAAGDDQAAVADLASGDVRTVDVPEGSALRRLRGTRALVVGAADTAGGPAVVITADGEVDVNAAADLEEGLYLAEQLTTDPAATAVLASELLTFQTVLVPLDGSDPTFYSGSAVALTADEVVTLERVGPSAEVVITPRDGGDERRIATTELRGVAATSEGGYVLVTEDGTVSTVGAGGDEAERAGQIELSGDARIETVVPFPAIDRVLLDDGERLHLVDALDGSVVQTIDASLGLGAPIGDPAQRCVSIVAGVGLTPFDLVTGELPNIGIEDVDRPTDTSVDGCTLIAQTNDGTSVLHAGEVIELDLTVVSAVAPDGSALVTVDRERNAELLLLDEPDADPIALDSTEASAFVFVEE